MIRTCTCRRSTGLSLHRLVGCNDGPRSDNSGIRNLGDSVGRRDGIGGKEGGRDGGKDRQGKGGRDGWSDGWREGQIEARAKGG